MSEGVQKPVSQLAEAAAPDAPAKPSASKRPASGPSHAPAPKRKSAVPKNNKVTNTLIKDDLSSSGGFGEPINRFGYKVQISLTEIEFISDSVWNSITSFDHRFTPQRITRAQFVTVNKCAVLVRMIYIAIKTNQFNPADAFPAFYSILEMFRSIPLHSVIADYILSLGIVDFDGISAYPYFSSLDELVEDLAFRFMVLVNGSYVYDHNRDDFMDINEAFQNCPLGLYLQCMGRVCDMTRSFRTIDWLNTDGRKTLLVSNYFDPIPNRNHGVAITNMTLHEFELGCIFQFWSTLQVRNQGDFNLFTVPRFMGHYMDRSVVLNRIIQTTLHR